MHDDQNTSVFICFFFIILKKKMKISAVSCDAQRLCSIYSFSFFFFFFSSMRMINKAACWAGALSAVRCGCTVAVVQNHGAEDVEVSAQDVSSDELRAR